MALAAKQWQRTGWLWTGFDVWTDADVPAELIHPNLVTRHGNFEWTLNQAHYALEPTSRQGEFLVHLDTETPGFETFLAEIDDAEKSPVTAIFPWKLHAGRNRLKVWPRNNAGRDGIASWIESRDARRCDPDESVFAGRGWCCRATSRRTGSLFSLRQRNADQVHVPPTVPGDIGDAYTEPSLPTAIELTSPGRWPSLKKTGP